MRLQELKQSKLLSFFVVVILLIFVGSLKAQNYSIKDVTSNKYALQNLLAGIKSDNEGVQRSSIYFAGKYRIAESESALIEQLCKEENPSTRMLIALVLYEMGSLEGLEAVRKLALNDVDTKVRRMSTFIHNEHLINDFHSSISLNK
jgi:HEAT repeat protein